MARSKKRVAILIAGLAVAVLVAACGGDDDDDGDSDGGDGGGTGGGAVAFEVPAGYTGPEADLPTEYAEPESCEGLTIGWQNPLAANENLSAQEEAFTIEVERLGGETITVDDEVDPDRQVSNMQRLLAQDADAIGFLPLDPSATDPILNQAERQNTPVLAIESSLEVDADPGNVATQIWQGRDMQAFNQATFTAEQVPDSDVALIGFAPPVPSIDYLEERVEFWSGDEGLNVVQVQESEADDSSGGEQAMTAIVAENPEVAAVIAYNDPNGLGAASAARAGGLEDVTIVGNNGGEDGLGGVSSGRLAATFQNDAVGIGIQGARALCTLGADPNADVPPIVVRPPSEAITADNVDQAQTWVEQIEALGDGTSSG